MDHELSEAGQYSNIQNKLMIMSVVQELSASSLEDPKARLGIFQSSGKLVSKFNCLQLFLNAHDHCKHGELQNQPKGEEASRSLEVRPGAEELRDGLSQHLHFGPPPK